MGRWQQELTESIEGMEEDLSETPAKVSASILQYSCLENPMDRGAWQVTVYGVPKSWTQLSDFHFHFSFAIWNS